MEQKLTKEEYAQKMKEKRLLLFDMANQQLIKTTSSNELYLNYLTLQGKLLYTVTNTLLVQTQKPDAILLKGQEMNEMISGLIREYIFIEVKNQYSSYDEAKFCVLSITQMICSRYGIENKNESIDCVNHFNGMDDKVIKSELQDMKKIFDSVNQRMEHGLYMKGKNNYRGHEER